MSAADGRVDWKEQETLNSCEPPTWVNAEDFKVCSGGVARTLLALSTDLLERDSVSF